MENVSVVIPVRNAEGTLTACLASLEQLDPQPREIIFVDNQSTDGSLGLLRDFAAATKKCPVTVVSEKKIGATAARNSGIRVAVGDLVVFTDADCIVDRAWISRLTRPFMDPCVGAVGGRVLPGPATSSIAQFSALFTLRLPERPARHDRWSPLEGGFPTANLAVRRGLLERLGGFVEEVAIYGEDYDLCARIYEQGCIIVYDPDAIVAHFPRKTVSGMLRQAFGFGRSHPFLIKRHPPKRLYVEFPGKTFCFKPWDFSGWIDCASADKKLLVLICAAWWYPPLWGLLVVYAWWLVMMTKRHAAGLGVPLSSFKVMVFPLLLIGKSLAMTVGRWWGSLKYRAVCL